MGTIFMVTIKVLLLGTHGVLLKSTLGFLVMKPIVLTVGFLLLETIVFYFWG